MKTNLFFILLNVVIYSSCTNNRKSNIILPQPDYPIKINLIEAMANPRDIKLSEIADSIAYIPLEYIRDKPVGVILNFRYFPNNIFIHFGGVEGGFYRFDGNGKFLNEISSKGRGPGEYTSGSKFSVINNPDRFYILSNFVPRNLLEFDYNGKYLSKVLTADPSDGDFESVSSERFLFLASTITRHDTSVKYLGCLRDRSNKLLMMIDHPFFSDPEFKNLERFIYGGGGSGVYYDRWPLFYDKNSGDTIYSIKNDSIYARYIIDKGTEGAPFEKLYSYSNTPERYRYLCPLPQHFRETPNDVFLMAIYKEEFLYLINYNKETQSVSSIKTPWVIPDNIREPATIYPKFENDIDGGISTGPGFSNREGDVWTYQFDAIYFKKMLTKEHFQKSKALYPEKKKALMRLVDSIKEDDNPIFIVVYLKKTKK